MKENGIFGGLLMTKDLFNRHITPACEYCAIGQKASNKEKVLCPKKGIVTPDYHCWRFRYDPLKRQPKKPVRQEFAAEDFSF